MMWWLNIAYRILTANSMWKSFLKYEFHRHPSYFRKDFQMLLGATPVKNITPPYPTKIVLLKICLREFDFGL